MSADCGNILTGSEDKSCILWDAETGMISRILYGHSNSITSLAISPDNKFAVSTSKDHTCIIWDIETGISFKPESNDLKLAAITPDCKMSVSASSDHTLVLWDLENGKQLNKMKGHKSSINTIVITPDRHHAISGSDDKTCIIWDLESGTAKKIFNGHNSRVIDLKVTPCGKQAISIDDFNCCILWEIETGEILNTLVKKNGFSSIAITLDGKHALIGSDEFYLWDLKNGQLVRTYNVNRFDPSFITFTPDGKRVLSSHSFLGKYPICILWDLRTGELLKTYSGHNKKIVSLKTTPDGNYFITASEDNTIIFWDLKSGKKIARYFSRGKLDWLDMNCAGIFTGGSSGEYHYLNSPSFYSDPNSIITTSSCVYDLSLNKYQKHSSDCPLCGVRFETPQEILDCIHNIEVKSLTKKEESPCLYFSDDAWEESGLLSPCPSCGSKLKFNPFIA